MELGTIFLLGLTTGGLTCLAVQGGLLATAMTRQVTVENTPKPSGKRKHHRKRGSETYTGVQLPKDPWPILYFLGAKLVAYTILGALLGALGSALQISPTVQGIMQIIAGVFMLITALNMLNVHPIFRYFVIQPPKFLTRFVRNQAKSEQVFAPVLLGLLTVLIPCGTTQAMEIQAISTGNALSGALIMAVFILGTAPTFFILGFVITQGRGKVQQVFAMATTALILILGVVSVNAGLNVMGSPLAPGRILQSAVESLTSTGTPTYSESVRVGDVQEVRIDVNDQGYFPNGFTAEQNTPLRLVLKTNKTYGCARAFTIPSLGINRVLPETGVTTIDLPAQQAGRLLFTCSMGMYTGVIVIN